jgi:S-adenosyl-L-methionine hydrolase (adenosine-forming)
MNSESASRSGRPVIALLTDFGHQDTFVGQMKGVILSECREATIIDLTHESPPHNVLAGALHLSAAIGSLPDGAIVVAVVDPGVGGDRRALYFEAGGRRYIAPDNGLLSAVIVDGSPTRCLELDPGRFSVGIISRTFHGRDVFARAAGIVARGVDAAELGTALAPQDLARIDIPVPALVDHGLDGEVLIVDRYGNAMTNIPAESFAITRNAVSIECEGFRVSELMSAYASVSAGQPVALISSMNTLELAVREGSAANRYGIRPGSSVRLRQRTEQ